MHGQPIKPPEDIKYLTPKKVSQRWRGIATERTLSNWRCLGTGPKYTKIGGRILYPVDEIEAWEKGRTVTSTAGYVKAVAIAVVLLSSPWARMFEAMAMGQAA